jgi:Holliday junction resolvase RusA-like endonuclease
MIFFRVDKEPVAKGRPRVTSRGGYVRAYTPKKTHQYEEEVRFSFMASTCEKMPVYEKGIPLTVQMTFGKSVPQSFTKKKRVACLSGEISPTGRADLDNYIKAVLDAINGGYAYEDDSQVVKIIAEKIYAETPYVEVRIWAEGENEESR